MKKIDIKVIIALFLLCLAALSIRHLAFFKKGSYALVTVNSVEYALLPLDSDCELYIPSNNGFNHLIIRAGEAYIEGASCPDKICVKHTAIYKLGETIVCLPNKVIIEIIAK